MTLTHYSIRREGGEWTIVDITRGVTVGVYQDRESAVRVAVALGTKRPGARFIDGDVRARVQALR